MAWIQENCPQCSASLQFEEDKSVIRCPWCGSALLVSGTEGIQRFLLHPGIADPPQARAIAKQTVKGSSPWELKTTECVLLYVPFWRIRGRSYCWVFGTRPMAVARSEALFPEAKERARELVTRVIDHTVPAFRSYFLGLQTLGIRPQAATLSPVEKAARKASLLPVEVPSSEILDMPRMLGISEKMASGLEADLVVERIVGVKTSLIYLPIWYIEVSSRGGHETMVLDATDGKVIARGQQVASLLSRLWSQQAVKPQPGEIKLVPFRCPQCGWDLPFGERNSLHLCFNCRRLWTKGKAGFAQLSYNVALPPPKARKDELLWVPFWRIIPNPLSLEAHARLLSMEALLRPLGGTQEEERPWCCYIPASSFSNPRAQLELARRITKAQPHLLWGEFPEGGKLRTTGADLGPKEAEDMMILVLAADIPFRNKTALEELGSLKLGVEDLRVCFMPFSPEPLFWREPHTGVAFPKAQVRNLDSYQGNTPYENPGPRAGPLGFLPGRRILGDGCSSTRIL